MTRPPLFLALAGVLALTGCDFQLANSGGDLRDEVSGVRMETRPDVAAEDRLVAEAAAAGDPRAMVEQASRLRSNRTPPPELRSTGTDGPAEARVKIAESGRRRTEAEAEAARLDRAAAEKGDVGAMVNTGVLCLKGAGPHKYMGAEQVPVAVCQDEAEAVRWFRLAMEKGSARGMAYYGYMTELGRGGLRKDPDAARRYYRDAAARGDADAARMLADMTRFRGASGTAGPE